jgi:hypothetical protein
MGAGADASAWTEHLIYAPALGTNENVVSVALAPSSDFAPIVGEAFYVVFEVEDPITQTHKLYLQKWTGSTFWVTPVALDSTAVPLLYNPSITIGPGTVTIAAHYDNAGCVGLKEYSYNIATGFVDATRVIDDGNQIPGANCEDIGHSHIVWSPADSTYHVCWTRKEGAGTGDEVYCSKRIDTALVWDAPENICGFCNLLNNQDHATIAINASGNRRVAYHDDIGGGGNNPHEATLAMYKPLGNKVTYHVPNGAAAPQPGWQDRPFIALDSTGKMHVAWEDGPTGNEVIKYVRCLYSTPGGCNANAEWEFNNVAISQAAAVRARYPHLMITFERTWISYEQELGNGTNDVVVLHRCLNVPNNQAWTISDPYPADNRNEFTEEYGTPHIASRSTGVAALYPTEVGTVTLRQDPFTGLYEGILYTRSEPSCP